MSQFEPLLHQAKNRQIFAYIVISASVFIGGLLVFGVYFFSKGVRVEIMPAEAKQKAHIEIVKGTALSVGDTVYSISEYPEIMVKAAGFRAKKEILNTHKTVKIHHVELVRLPGRLMVKTMPHSNATRWFIDGAEVGKSAVLDYELEIGHYQLLVSNPCCEEKTLEVRMDKADTINLNVDLQPMVGKMIFDSKPRGALIVIDDEAAGSTPLTVIKMAGNYDVKLKLAGYAEINDTVEVNKFNLMPKRNYFLESEKAKINLFLNPPGGVLLHNGLQVKNLNSISADASAEHRLSYRKDGYQKQSKTVSLSPGEVLNINFDLTEEFGLLDISAEPDATIFIDGAAVGKTPKVLTLKAVPHRLVLAKEGYTSIEKTIQISPNSTKKIKETLVLESVTRLRKAPAQYTHKAGGQMKLFTPNEQFHMGADRSEAGQRANEVVRKIKLTRPFYAGLYEVTNGEFEQFKTPGSTDKNYPVTSVKWSEAAAFCNWLSQREKRKPFYNISANTVAGFNPDANGYRLLSEAEWEWLARKSGKNKQTIFTWGNTKAVPSRAANIADESAIGKVKTYVPGYNDGFPALAPVGSFKREKSGLFDMAGNVSEWTHDAYFISVNIENTATDPLGPQTGGTRVVKGANWRSARLSELRSSFREGMTDARDDLGFRIARYL